MELLIILLKLIVMFMLLQFSQFSFACLPDKKPTLNFEEYESIFIGQVVGIHLNEYQDKTISALREGKDHASFPAGSTPEYTVTVIPHRLFKGHASEVEILKIYGCDVSVPSTLQRGVFFIQPDEEVFVLYSSDYYDYEDYLVKASEYWRSQKQKLTIQRGPVKKEAE